MEELRTFLDMGGYAAFIWPVYGAALIVCAGLWWRTTRTLKQLEGEQAAANAQTKDEDTLI